MKTKIKKIIREIIEEVLSEMTTTGAVSGYQTPFAFSKSGKVNKSRIQKNSAGYTLVQAEEISNDSDDKVENILEGYHHFKKNSDIKNDAKISLSLQEVNKILRRVEYLVELNKRLKTETGAKASWKRSSIDVAKINERMKNISHGIKLLSKGIMQEQVEFDKTEKITDIPLLKIMSDFEYKIGNVLSATESTLRKILVGKKITVKASKGYGQIEKDYVIKVTSLSIGLFKERYILILKDSDGKEYFVSSTYKSKLHTKLDATKDIQEPTKKINPPVVTKPTGVNVPQILPSK